MTRVRLPEGVPFDNTKRAMSAGDGAFAAPDTATPSFARVEPVAAQPASDIRPMPKAEKLLRAGVYVEKEAENGEEDNDPVRLIHGPHAPAPLLILIAIALVLAAFAAYAVSRNSGGEPLCADQPEWNQYNCRTN
ncbi:MAG: hypothetical protein R3C58_14025 [Parvularculaceae bacterium]